MSDDFFKDPWNPTEDELRVWAYSDEEDWPEQDFDLAVGDLRFSSLIIELSEDDKCPAQDFFLQCAYLIIGDAIRSNYQTSNQKSIESFLEDIKTGNNSKLNLLYSRASDLIENPSTFDYWKWCGGDLVYNESNLND